MSEYDQKEEKIVAPCVGDPRFFHVLNVFEHEFDGIDGRLA